MADDFARELSDVSIELERVSDLAESVGKSLTNAFRGAIVECGHMGPWRELGARAKPESSFYLFTREGDFNQPATHKLHRAMYDARCRVKLEERRGGHTPMMPDEIGPALAWLASV